MKNMEEMVRDFVSAVIKYYTSEIEHKNVAEKIFEEVIGENF